MNKATTVVISSGGTPDKSPGRCNAQTLVEDSLNLAFKCVSIQTTPNGSYVCGTIGGLFRRFNVNPDCTLYEEIT